MEVQVEDAAVVAPDGAAAAGLGNEDPFDLLVAPCDRLAHAALTTPTLSGLPGRIQVEGDKPVALAVTELCRAALRRWAACLAEQRDGWLDGS
jgi:hypothetical protein